MSLKTKDAPASVWNTQELLGRVDNDPELMHEILGIFRTEFPRALRALALSVADGDVRKSATLSHTLKGMLANIAAPRAAAAAANLERLAAAGDRGALATGLDKLQIETAALQPHLEAYLAEVRP
ncbi:MAG TPA: Hpt domain-containing protein [Candidatus Acidoferrum sp.]|nr:Hpt domain-containing protein [Candidatus Acidoferrum sp.]